MWYTSSYLAGVMWLSLRLSPLYPASLTPLDPALCAATSMPQRASNPRPTDPRQNPRLTDPRQNPALADPAQVCYSHV